MTGRGLGLGLHRHEATRAQEEQWASDASISPPLCTECGKKQWPAKRSNKGRWICMECHGDSPLHCHVCISASWDGYNRPWKEGGKWMCAECWSQDAASYHVTWKVWFERRREKYPEVMRMQSAQSGIEEYVEKERGSILWSPHGDLKAIGSLGRWQGSVTEVSLGKKGWTKLCKNGDIIQDSSRLPTCVPPDFFLEFMSSRLDREGAALSNWFEKAVDDFVPGWRYYALKTERGTTSIRMQKLKRQALLSGYHATRWLALFHQWTCRVDRQKYKEVKSRNLLVRTFDAWCSIPQVPPHA